MIMFYASLNTDMKSHSFRKSPSMYFSNNKSALSNEKNVSEAISELVQSGCVIKVHVMPPVFRLRPGVYPGRGKNRSGGPFFQNTSTDWKATSVNRM